MVSTIAVEAEPEPPFSALYATVRTPLPFDAPTREEVEKLLTSLRASGKPTRWLGPLEQIAQEERTYRQLAVGKLSDAVRDQLRHLDGSRRRLMAEADKLFIENAREAGGLGHLVGKSNLMLEVFRRTLINSRSDASVLIQGESGTGKELVARTIHAYSLVSKGPFIAWNCAQDELIENELFGHELGAYTDAKGSQVGLLERATGGTLFLDEITDMPLHVQAKLLRALQDGWFHRLGGAKDLQAKFRLVTATNQDVAELVRQGRFRSDLLGRISALSIQLPPLRQRVEDIESLSLSFLRQRGHTGLIDPEALALLGSYSWPLNVRELKGVCVALHLGDGVIVNEADVRAVLPQRRTPHAKSIAAGVERGATASKVLEWKNCQGTFKGLLDADEATGMLDFVRLLMDATNPRSKKPEALIHWLQDWAEIPADKRTPKALGWDEAYRIAQKLYESKQGSDWHPVRALAKSMNEEILQEAQNLLTLKEVP